MKSGRLNPLAIWWGALIVTAAIVIYALYATHQYGLMKAQLQTQKEARTYSALLQNRLAGLEGLMVQGARHYLQGAQTGELNTLLRFGVESSPELIYLAILDEEGTALAHSSANWSLLDRGSGQLTPADAGALAISHPFETTLAGEPVWLIRISRRVASGDRSVQVVGCLRLDTLSHHFASFVDPVLPLVLARQSGEVLFHLTSGVSLPPGEQMSILKEGAGHLDAPITRLFEGRHDRVLYVGTAHPLGAYGLIVSSATPHEAALSVWRTWAPVAAIAYLVLMIAAYLLAQRMVRINRNRARSEALYRTLFHALDDPVFMVRTQSDPMRFKGANPALYRALGVQPARFDHQPLEAMGSFGAEVARQCAVCIEKRDGLTYEHRFKLGEKEHIWMVVLSPILDSQGDVYLIVAVCRDVTDSRQHEELLEDFNEQLALHVESEVDRRLALEKEQEKNRKLLIQQSKMAELGNMIGTIAHQWKQPLNAIGLSAQSMAMDADLGELDAQKAQEGADRIMDHIRFMSQTMDEFRSFYKPDRQKECFDLAPALDRVIHLLEPTLEKASITLNVQSAKEVQLSGFPNEFQQVILNLLNNAIDAIKQREVKEGVIALEIEHTKEGVLLRVQDNAGGIDEKLLPEALFDPFASTKGEKGTGVGLSLSKTIIEERMGGLLRACNRQGGAALEVLLPVE
jgi:PAS domain S-box-containing protein